MDGKLERKSRYCKKRSTIWARKAENRCKSGTKIEILQKMFHYLGSESWKWAEKWNENRDIAKNVPLFGLGRLEIGAKMERKSRYCKKRSTIWARKAGNRCKSGTKIEILQKMFHYLGSES